MTETQPSFHISLATGRCDIRPRKVFACNSWNLCIRLLATIIVLAAGFALGRGLQDGALGSRWRHLPQHSAFPCYSLWNLMVPENVEECAGANVGICRSVM